MVSQENIPLAQRIPAGELIGNTTKQFDKIGGMNNAQEDRIYAIRSRLFPILAALSMLDRCGESNFREVDEAVALVSFTEGQIEKLIDECTAFLELRDAERKAVTA